MKRVTEIIAAIGGAIAGFFVGMPPIVWILVAVMSLDYLTGLLCGFTSWLYSSSVMAVAAASAGNGFEMDAIAAVAIGGTAMSGGRGKIIGTFLGVLIFKIIYNTLVAAKVPTFLTGAFSGAIIIIAVLLQNVRGQRK